MRFTDDQREEMAWFRAQVATVNPRARVVRDSEGWLLVPGSMGQVETALDRTLLAVFTTRRVVDKLLAMPGVRRHQMGDTEARMLFPAGDPACLRAVFSVIHPRVRRVMTAARRAVVARQFAAARSQPQTTTAAPGSVSSNNPRALDLTRPPAPPSRHGPPPLPADLAGRCAPPRRSPPGRRIHERRFGR